MKRNWPVRPLSELVTSRPGNNKIIKGKQSAEPDEGLVQGFSASGPDVWVTNAEYNQPGVVISAVGARCGKTFMATGKWTAVANTHVLIPSSSIDPRWLWYRTNDESFWIKGGSAQPFVKVKETLQRPCRVPPLHEQQHIVGILDEAFDSIAAAKANAEKNRQNARALFGSYRHAVFSQRNGQWAETTVDKLSTNLDSMRVPITKSDRTSGEHPYYGASGIVDYVYDYIFEGDTLLISEDGANLLMRSTPIAFSVSGKYWVNNHAHILKFENMITQRFVEFYLNSIKLDEYITGAAQPKLNQKALNSIPIPIPKSLPVQAAIVENIEALSVETQRLESVYRRKLAALDELKKSLLHKAFTGEL